MEDEIVPSPLPDDQDEIAPSPLAGNQEINMSSVLLYGLILIAFFVVFGVISYIVIRKRKQKANSTVPPAITERNSTTSSTMSDAEISQNP